MRDDETSAAAQVVVPCAALDRELRFLIDRLGFRLDMIMPADSPRIAEVSGHGIRLRLEQHTDLGAAPRPVTLRLPASLKDRLQSAIAEQSPGIAIEFDESAPSELSVAEVSRPLINRVGDDASWASGRAGMHYRDLIPGRLDGSVIASHIRIVEGGPVDDYVHYHKVGLQLIYCRRGWVRVVYEDQGEPFVMQPGDCVLQPPTIRHRVLESSAGLEVIELGSPAEHETRRDHELSLPTPSINPLRLFNGQRFVRHVAAESEWMRLAEGVCYRETGIGAATEGDAGARVLKLAGSADKPITHSSQTDTLRFIFVLDGGIQLTGCANNPISLAADDACVLPSHQPYSLRTSIAAEVLEISFPAP